MTVLDAPLNFVVSRSKLLRRLDVSYARGARIASPEGVATEPLSTFLTDVRYGTSIRTDSEPVGVPVLRMGNIQDGEIDYSDLKYAILEPHEIARWSLRKGDVLINRTNTGDLVGKSAVFRQEGDWVFASYLIRLRIDTSRLDPEFLVLWLNSSHGRRQIDSFSRQSAGMTNINSTEIAGISVPVISLARQRELAAAVFDTKSALTRATRKSVDAQRIVADELRQIFEISSALQQRGANIYQVSRAEFMTGARMDVSFMNPERLAVISAIAAGVHPTARLGGLVRIRKQRSVDPQPQLGLANVASNSGVLLEDAPPKVASSSQVFQTGDVLISRLRPALNKVWLATFDGFCSPEFRVLIPNEAQDASFIALVLRSLFVVSQTRHAVTGNTLPRISDPDLTNVIMPWPDKPIRDRIVARVALIESDAAQELRYARDMYAAALSDFTSKLDAS